MTPGIDLTLPHAHPTPLWQIERVKSRNEKSVPNFETGLVEWLMQNGGVNDRFPLYDKVGYQLTIMIILYIVLRYDISISYDELKHIFEQISD